MMYAYLFYHPQDVLRNETFITWFMDEGKALNLDIILVTSDENYPAMVLPDFVINRSRDFKVSQFYESLKVKVFNSSKVTKITNDKLLTYDYLLDKQIPLLKTYRLTHKPHFYPCIIKSLDGHGGKDVYFVKTEADIPLKKNAYLYQVVADQLGKDLRVFVMGNKIIASVLRTNARSFKSNYSLGGNIELYQLNASERQVVNDIIACFEFDYVGIDFLFDQDNHLILNEIEDAVGSRMLSALTDLNVVSMYLNHIKKSL